ncbi:hypothetical protein [Allopusillimonas ginsengisoli]|uniref:hypothetical protein n=1 Tax=Allopusillimonas ginsengisoli TaxID=453575 RepID=UPI00101F63F5|nr:hypothetical protein [Allopusillimonas ginsengisoli]TEA78956.1 hypothetical protein ERE07_06030 [Allopusillimonas ginsengisoli]
MTTWYILPNGNIKNINGLELQPEKDWFPTDQSLAAYVDAEQDAGKSQEQIIKQLMDLAIACEAWAQDNLG